MRGQVHIDQTLPLGGFTNTGADSTTGTGVRVAGVGARVGAGGSIGAAEVASDEGSTGTDSGALGDWLGEGVGLGVAAAKPA